MDRLKYSLCVYFIRHPDEVREIEHEPATMLEIFTESLGKKTTEVPSLLLLVH